MPDAPPTPAAGQAPPPEAPQTPAERGPTSSTRRELVAGLGFLAPNIFGVLAFVVFPVVFSLGMAFTDWDLTQQNMFKPEASVQFTGLDNLNELVTEGRVGAPSADGDPVGFFEAAFSSRFVRFFGNTLFFMMGIPLAVGGSLIAAILLSQDTRGGGGRNFAWLIAGGVMLSSCVLLATLGLGASAMTLLVVGTGCAILLMGLAGGLTFYRTVFYTPHFVTGVATFVLWKNLYSKQTGPINLTLQPVLDRVSAAVAAVPAWVLQGLHLLGYALLLGVLWRVLDTFRRMHRDGDLGWAAAAGCVALLCLPFPVAWAWYATEPTAWLLIAGAGVVAAAQIVLAQKSGERFPSRPAEGVGSGLVLSVFAMVAMFVLLGLSATAWWLPGLVEGRVEGGKVVDAPGLEAPSWLNGYHYAKPALMFMAIWGAIGSNNMLLYLAGLSNVPGELYEAADIDGATPLARFWNVTWPQLAPTTFFIFVMSTIAGLQGGFEAARVMTQGGPAGSTTTLSYFIYQEGFETGRLGFASAVAWVLFLLVFGVTLFNWKFGNKYVD